MPVECGVELMDVGRERFYDRTAFRVHDAGWEGSDEASRRLRETIRALLSDWGAFLDAGLYREALMFLLNGSGCAGLRQVDICVGGEKVGTHGMCMLDADTAWHLSAVKKHSGSYETHLRRLLSHVQLRRIKWINLNRRDITLKTLKK